MTVKEKAYAKINLFLDVTERRDDGFHNIVSIMQSVSLCDEIILTAEPSDKAIINITSNNKSLATDESNLIYKSALKYMSYFNICADINLRLKKRIPIGAGLGGGSSDAAATLRAMNKLYGFATKEQLLSMASELGSDVPFCIDGGCALCKGRGEKLDPIKLKSYPYFVIAIGDGRVSTPEAYRLLDEKYFNFQKIRDEEGFSDILDLPNYNIFEDVICTDEIAFIKKVMADKGAKRALMSGSGPSVWGGFCNCYSASLAASTLKKAGIFAVKCRPM